MKQMLILLVLFLPLSAYAQDQKTAPTLKSILLEQLRTTHNEKDWFVYELTPGTTMTVSIEGKDLHAQRAARAKEALIRK